VTFRHLEAFWEVARRRGFTKAADVLYLTQPTISGQIKELEEELGVVLFHRLPRTVELTEAGKLFLPKAREILEARDHLAESAAQYRGLLWGILELHASTIPGEYLLPPMLARFKEAHPEVRAVLRIHSSAEVLARLEAGEAALGVAGETGEGLGLASAPLWFDRVALYAAAGSSIPEELPLEDLPGIPLAQREEGSATRKSVENALAKFGLPARALNVRAELGSTSAVKEAAKAGVGAAFLSQVAVACELRAGLLREVRIHGFPPVERRFHAVWDPQRTLSPAARAFLALLTPAAST
jgi:DNA-binding transcriptional LysR family regulator